MEKTSVFETVWGRLVKKHPALVAVDFAFGFAIGWLVCRFL